MSPSPPPPPEMTPKQRAEVYQRALLNGFERQIQNPILKDLLGKDYYSVDKQTKNDIIGFPDFQQACEKKVREVADLYAETIYTKAIIATAINKLKGTQK